MLCCLLWSASSITYAREVGCHDAGIVPVSHPDIHLPVSQPGKHISHQSEKEKLFFLENMGQVTDQHMQVRRDIHFKMNTPGLHIFIGSGKIHYQFSRPVSGNPLNENEAVQFAMSRMDVTLAGANAHAVVQTEEKQDYYEQHYLTHANEGNRVLAKAYKKITYKNIYPHIDWVLYVKGDHLEYDFVVHPGGKVSDIRMVYNGGQPELQPDGSLKTKTPMGEIKEKAPYSYQSDGAYVPSRFIQKNNELRFATAPYEGTLIIDPVLSWGTYYGDTLMDYCNAVAADTFGNVYITGHTYSTQHIATSGSYQDTLAGSADAYIVRFNRDGVRQWGTYYGGPGTEQMHSVFCDGEGNVLIAGYVQSPITDLITIGSLLGGDDAFVAKFDSSGNRLWARCYGGNNTDRGRAVTADRWGNVYLTGYTTSKTTQPVNLNAVSTPGSHQQTSTSTQDAFLVKFNSAGIRQWGTYYGGNRAEDGLAVACDDSGNVYMAGLSRSNQGVVIATAGSHQAVHGDGNNDDAFLVKFDSSGARQWGTYYGADKHEVGNAVVCDKDGNVYLTGYTSSDSMIQSAVAWQTERGGLKDAFLVKFNRIGERQWGTYFGGNKDEEANGITVDHMGDVWITGYTNTDTLIHVIVTPGSHQDVKPGGRDVFLARFDGNGDRKWSTYYGGSSFDNSFGAASDMNGSVYIAGYTMSRNGIATPGSHQDTLPHEFNYHTFLARFWECPTPMAPPDSISGSDSVCANAGYTFSVSPVAEAMSYTWTLPSGWTGNSNTNTINITPGTSGGTIEVIANGACDTSAAFRKSVHVFPAPTATITVNGDTIGTTHSFVSYQWYRDGDSMRGETGSIHKVVRNGSYTVKVFDNNGCSDSSTAYTVNNVSVSNLTGNGLNAGFFPNPAHDRIYISATAEPANIIIRTLEGKMLAQQKGVREADISNLPDGMYLVYITDDKGTLLYVDKLVKSSR